MSLGLSDLDEAKGEAVAAAGPSGPWLAAGAFEKAKGAAGPPELENEIFSKGFFAAGAGGEWLGWKKVDSTGAGVDSLGLKNIDAAGAEAELLGWKSEEPAATGVEVGGPVSWVVSSALAVSAAFAKENDEEGAKGLRPEEKMEPDV